MAKFAPVCPAHVYRQLREISPVYFGDYFLLLAHDVVNNPIEYSSVFNFEKLPYETTIIMDNSVIELGGSVDIEVVKDAVFETGATVVVLPDVLEDGLATIKSTLHALDVQDWGDIFSLQELMFVPQGKTLEDFCNCLEVVAKHASKEIEWVGIPRNTPGRIVESRWTLVDIVKEVMPHVKIHLLGFSDYLEDDFRSCKHPFVEGIDSAVPLRLANQGKSMTVDSNPGPRGDWWDHASVNIQTLRNLDAVRALIATTSYSKAA